MSTAAPPPTLTISEWADRHRKLSPESFAEPGQWRTSRAEYQRGMMDALTEPGVQRLVLMTSSQMGKSEVELNVLGYHIAQDPSPVLVVMPTLELAEAWSKDRLAPVLRDTPTLVGRVADPRARDSGNTLLHKSFTGGHLTAIGANSPSSLSMRPIRLVLADEIDRYPVSAGTQGDPLSLAIRRTARFWNRRIVIVSTPTIKGYSRIEVEFARSDQRRYFLSCPHCGHAQHLVWRQVKWPKGRSDEACYHCEACGCGWSEAERLAAIRWGKWLPTAKGSRGIVGFHISELYTTFGSIPEIVAGFLEAKDNPETLKTWTNTVLGELWEEDAERVDQNAIASRAAKEDWSAAPGDVRAVTVGVDVQADRLEIERVGWGPGDESWSLEYEVIPGDPASTALWKQLEDYLLTPTIREDGVRLPVHAACIDSGAFTQMVYRFAKPRHKRRVYAIKGMAGPGRPVWPKLASRDNKQRAPVYVIGVDAAKDIIYANLKIAEAGPGYCHFPQRSSAYFDQLTAEEVRTKHVRGFPLRVYWKPDNRRNEALDCRVYAYAALQSLEVRWNRVLSMEKARQVARETTPESDAVVPGQATTARSLNREPPPGSLRRRLPVVRRSSWMS